MIPIERNKSNASSRNDTKLKSKMPTTIPAVDPPRRKEEQICDLVNWIYKSSTDAERNYKMRRSILVENILIVNDRLSPYQKMYLDTKNI